MSKTNTTLPQSAISLVSFLPASIWYLLVARLGPIWSQERLPAKETPMLKSAKNSQRVKSRD